MTAIRLVFRGFGTIALGTACALAALCVFLWSSQVISVGRSGIHLFPQLHFIAAAVVIALLFGLLIPMQVYAIRIAAVSARATGGTVLGAIIGTASMTCCAPVIIPSLLALLGFSGTTILSLNLLLEHFWLPIGTLSAILLSYSLVSVSDAISQTCRVRSKTALFPNKELIFQRGNLEGER